MRTPSQSVCPYQRCPRDRPPPNPLPFRLVAACSQLTVFKHNPQALGFYTNKLQYGVDDTSPSVCYDPEDSDAQVDYEILSKCLAPPQDEKEKEKEKENAAE